MQEDYPTCEAIRTGSLHQGVRLTEVAVLISSKLETASEWQTRKATMFVQ